MKDEGSSISEAGVLYPERIVDTGEEGDTSVEDENGRASKQDMMIDSDGGILFNCSLLRTLCMLLSLHFHNTSDLAIACTAH
jgi:hypothetical protein